MEKDLSFENEVFLKLREAEREADLTGRRYTPEEVLSAIRKVTAEEKHYQNRPNRTETSASCDFLRAHAFFSGCLGPLFRIHQALIAYMENFPDGAIGDEYAAVQGRVNIQQQACSGKMGRNGSERARR